VVRAVKLLARIDGILTEYDENLPLKCGRSSTGWSARLGALKNSFVGTRRDAGIPARITGAGDAAVPAPLGADELDHFARSWVGCAILGGHDDAFR
jgi:hypothetical protein